jgi:uncharacterized protein
MIGHLAAALLDALGMAFAMGWEILWALILGFALSAVVQAVVSHAEMTRLLPDDGARAIARATLLGAASSSCSYAATALARSIFRKGGNFTAAMAFEMASTNLVIELGIILIVLLGWQFALAEFIGGVLMIVILVAIFRRFLGRRLLDEAKAQADKGVAGRMEGHAAMDMSVPQHGSLWQRIRSDAGRTAISHYFIMDWASIWIDIVGGLLIAGALAAWVPESFWAGLFIIRHPLLATLIGPLIGTLVAVVSFVCSVGNVPLAAVLWSGGASFGGVIAFIFADLVILPILDIYRRYYGIRMAAFLFASFVAAMALAALAVELVFAALDLVPTARPAHVALSAVGWNYTTILNLVFLVVAALLLRRFLRTGGPAMLRMMSAAPGEGHACHAGAPAHDHAHHHHH